MLQVVVPGPPRNLNGVQGALRLLLADPARRLVVTRWLGVQSDDSLPLRGELETSASAVPGQHGVPVGADPRLNLPQAGGPTTCDDEYLRRAQPRAPTADVLHDGFSSASAYSHRSPATVANRAVP